MPLGIKPVCTICKTTNSAMWRKGPQGEILCNSCGLKQPGNGRESTPPESINKTNGNGSSSSNQGSSQLRKSSRIKPSKYKTGSSGKSFATKGKNRRVIFKKNVVKAATAVATVTTSNYVFHNGTYFQVGDIVSVMDEDGGIYYAQLRGLLTDQFCEKSAVITWLLPTQSSPRDRFDPGTYIIGPEEELPRKLDCFQFVCHAPSDYYKAENSPYPTPATTPELGYIWTTIGPEIIVAPSRDEIFFGTSANKKTRSPSKKDRKNEERIRTEKLETESL